jgi:hypothetical protein
MFNAAIVFGWVHWREASLSHPTPAEISEKYPILYLP